MILRSLLIALLTRIDVSQQIATEFHCLTVSNTKLEESFSSIDCGGGCKKVTVTEDDKNVTCPEGYMLTLKDGNQQRLQERLIDVPLARLTCDTETGLFKAAYGADFRRLSPIALAPNMTVYCRAPADEAAARAAAIPYIVGGVLAAVVLAGLAAGLTGFFVRRRIVRARERRAFLARYPDGLMTAREIDPLAEKVKTIRGKWRLVPLEGDEVKEALGKKEMDAIKANPYHVDVKLTKINCELTPKVGELLKWNADQFEKSIMTNFPRYSLTYRIETIRRLTQFKHYAEETKNDHQNFGTIEQFVDLIYAAQQYRLKCWKTWDFLLRLARFFIANLKEEAVPEKIENFKLTATHCLRGMFERVASEMMDNVRYENKKGWSVYAKEIRAIAMRMLLWVEHPRCVEKAKAMCEAPIKQWEEPLRLSLLSWAVNKGGRETQIKEAFYEEVKSPSGREPVTGKIYGTYRQQLLWALCTSEKAELRKEILEYCIMDPNSTPTDMHWAFKGATDDLNTSAAATEMFGKHFRGVTPDQMRDRLHVVVLAHATTDRDRASVQARFKTEIVEMCTRLVESCTTPYQYDDLKDACSGLLKYAMSEDANFVLDASKVLATRASNIRGIFANEKLNLEFVAAIKRRGYKTLREMHREEHETFCRARGYDPNKSLAAQLPAADPPPPPPAPPAPSNQAAAEHRDVEDEIDWRRLCAEERRGPDPWERSSSNNEDPFEEGDENAVPWSSGRKRRRWEPKDDE